MKIIDDRTQVNITFGHLGIGATFMFYGKLYMKINCANAVNLNSGFGTSIDDDSLVAPVKVELHIVD